MRSSPLQVFLTPAYRAEDGELPPAPAPIARSVESDGDGLEGDVAGDEVSEPIEEPPPAAELPDPHLDHGPKKPWDEPPRDASVEVHFAAPEAAVDPSRWIVLSPEGDVLCELPCVRRVGSRSGIRLQLDADRKEDIKVIPLPEDLGYSPGRKVRAVPELGGPSHLGPALTTAIGGVITGVGLGLFIWSEPQETEEGSDESACDVPQSAACNAGLGLSVAGVIALLCGATWWLSVASNERHGDLELTLLESDRAGLRLDVAPSGLVGHF